jgi:hypothetical protein
MDMQTEDFLEELTDKPVEIDAETQTQAFMDRPASPLFVPTRIGQDMVTQIMPGDLFDFDLEVEPILEVNACFSPREPRPCHSFFSSTLSL